MPMPFASPLRLADDERQGLESLARAHSTPQALALRWRLILRGAAPEAPTNLRVAADLHCHRQTVSLWRTRYLEHGLAGLQDAPQPGRPRRFAPSERIAVLSRATSTLADHHRPVTRWSLDAMAAVLRDHARARTMSRSPLWRGLDEAEIKPQRCVYWLHSHAPECDAKARDLCPLSVHALRFFQQGRLVICVDETTAMQMLQRKYPTHPAPPGKPAKREQESIRPGVRVLLASCVVPTGQVLGHLGPPRTREDCAAQLADVHRQRPAMARDDGVVDHLTTPWSLAVCRLVATWCHLPCDPKTLRRGVPRRTCLRDPTHQHVCHLTPTHGAWRNQVALGLSVLARRLLKRGDFCAPEDFTTRLLDSLAVYNTHHAHPYRWTSTGQPWVRATPFSQTRRQQRLGRAWCSPRPHCFARALYPPRP